MPTDIKTEVIFALSDGTEIKRVENLNDLLEFIEKYRYVNADKAINKIANLAITEDGMVSVVDVMKVINDMCKGGEV